jgi:hypothetical protein
MTANDNPMGEGQRARTATGQGGGQARAPRHREPGLRTTNALQAGPPGCPRTSINSQRSPLGCEVPEDPPDLTRDIRGMILLAELSLDANDAGSTADQS